MFSKIFFEIIFTVMFSKFNLSKLTLLYNEPFSQIHQLSKYFVCGEILDVQNTNITILPR